MTTIDQIPGLREILVQLEAKTDELRTNTDISLIAQSARIDSMSSAIDLKIGDTAERARSNLTAIDELTTKLQRELTQLRQEFVNEIGSKGRIDAIETKLGATYDASMAALNEQRLEVVKKVAQIDGKILDFESAAIDSENKVKAIQNDLDRRAQVLEVAVQGAYAAVQAVGPSAGGGSGGSSKTLSQERALSDIGKITGGESVTSLLDWKRKISIIIDTVLPGAFSILEWCEKSKTAINTESMTAAVDRLAVSPLEPKVMGKLNAQLYALMMVKMGGRAETIMKSIDHRCGLEAWRQVWDEIGRKDEQSLHAEFIRCTDVKQTKKTSELSSDIIRWEKRLNDLQGANKDEFTVGTAHKMTILKNMLPTELAGLV